MSDTEDQTYSLDELAEKTGFDKRVIRSFIEQGLLPGPDTMGRYARYSHWHLVKLLAIKELKTQSNAKLSEVRQVLNTQSPQVIEELAQQQSLSALPMHHASKQEDEQEQLSSALDFIKSINAPQEPGQSHIFSLRAKFSKGASASSHPTSPDSGNWSSAAPLPPKKGKTAVDFLLEELSKLIAKPKIRRQAKGETWYRIAITPDVELSVRGIQDPDQLARLEQVADYLREIFLRGGPPTT